MARPRRVLLHGNVRHPHSTEKILSQTLSGMGVEVVEFQEQEATAEQLITRAAGCDFMLWLHSHGWQTQGATLEWVTRFPVPVVGYTLDLIRDLDREHLTRTHPWFHGTRFFSPDGRDDGWWEAHGVAHRYMPPAILERYCYLAEHDAGYEQNVAPIIFVGTYGYHREWPRSVLIDWLRSTYASRFQLFEHDSGMRADRLNALYRHAKVVVGDSCFAGRIRGYTSDRFYETLGRGGRLVYPRIPGVTDAPGIPCLWLYDAGDMDSLAAAIDAALAPVNPVEEYQQRQTAVAWVRGRHTYRHRMEALFAQLEREGVIGP